MNTSPGMAEIQASITSSSSRSCTSTVPLPARKPSRKRAPSAAGVPAVSARPTAPRHVVGRPRAAVVQQTRRPSAHQSVHGMPVGQPDQRRRGDRVVAPDGRAGRAPLGVRSTARPSLPRRRRRGGGRRRRARRSRAPPSRRRRSSTPRRPTRGRRRSGGRGRAAPARRSARRRRAPGRRARRAIGLRRPPPAAGRRAGRRRRARPPRPAAWWRPCARSPSPSPPRRAWCPGRRTRPDGSTALGSQSRSHVSRNVPRVPRPSAR